MSIAKKIDEVLSNPKFSREKMVERLRLLFEEENQAPELLEAKIRYRTLCEVEDQFARSSQHKAVKFIRKEKDNAIDTIDKLR